jgi:hypothetical protein
MLSYPDRCPSTILHDRFYYVRRDLLGYEYGGETSCHGFVLVPGHDPCDGPYPGYGWESSLDYL